MYNFRTDLASERRDLYQKANKLEEIEGIETEKEDIDENLKVERVKITNENGEKAIGKPIGNYVTIDIKILVVGLGNIYVTPDSLGPKVINEIEVTRHIINYLPQYVEEGTRMVSAISPGVLRNDWNRNSRDYKRYCW